MHSESLLKWMNHNEDSVTQTHDYTISECSRQPSLKTKLNTGVTVLCTMMDSLAESDPT